MFHRKKNLAKSSSYNPPIKGNIAVCHKIVCTLAVVWVLHCALQCVSALADAFQSVRKYEYTDNLSLYLLNNHFLHYVLILACVGAEFIFYLIHHHRIKQSKSSAGIVQIFAVIMLMHLVVFLFASFVPGSELPPFSTEDIPILLIRHFARKTLLPTVAYFIMILLSARRFDSTTK